MAERNQTKAERREARAAAGTTKAERREARSGKGGKGKQKRDRKPGRGARGAVDAPAEDASLEERIDWRLARIEEAVAKQSERSEELLERVTDLLQADPEGTARAD
jgi:hypothetical protein